MATKLENEVIRESSQLVDEREIVVGLHEDQTISLRLKGMKSGEVSIGIRELYYQLTDVEEDTKPSKEATVVLSKDGPMISLHRLRSLNAVTQSKIDVTAKLDEIFVDLLKQKS